MHMNRSKAWNVVGIGLIVLAGAAAWSNSLHGPFHYDDIASIVENPGIRTLNPARVLASNNRFRFAGFYSFALNYRLNGLDGLYGWHAVNIGVHLLCAILLGTLAGTFGGNDALETGVMTGVLFAVHPLCSEPVNYIQARHVLWYSVAALWGVLSARAWHEGKTPGRRIRGAIGMAGAVLLGAAAKEVGLFYVPAGIALYFSVFGLRGRGTGALRLCTAAGAASLAYVAWRNGYFEMIVGRHIHPVTGETGFTVRVLTAAKVFWGYLRLAIPDASRLSVDHQIALVDPREWTGMAAGAASFAGIGLLAAVGLWMRRRSPCAAFMLLWIVMGHLPYLPAAGTGELMVEYKAYLSLMGLAGLTAWALERAGRSAGAAFGIGWGRATAWGACGLLVLYCVGEARERNRVWASELVLWEDAVAKSPGNPRALAGRANALCADGDYDRAIEDCTRAIELNPNYPWPWYNRGVARMRRGAYGAAIGDFRRVLELLPGNSDAMTNLGTAYKEAGMPRRAVEEFTRLIEAAPASADAWNNRGAAYAEAGDYERALSDFNKALSLDPDSPTARYNRTLLSRDDAASNNLNGN